MGGHSQCSNIETILHPRHPTPKFGLVERLGVHQVSRSSAQDRPLAAANGKVQGARGGVNGSGKSQSPEMVAPRPSKAHRRDVGRRPDHKESSAEIENDGAIIYLDPENESGQL